jgi:hypothetical protein
MEFWSDGPRYQHSSTPILHHYNFQVSKLSDTVHRYIPGDPVRGHSIARILKDRLEPLYRWVRLGFNDLA